MCGRFAATTDPARLAQQLDAIDETGEQGIRPPNFNVAPTLNIAALVCRHSEPGGSARLAAGEATPGPTHQPGGSARLAAGEATPGPTQKPGGSARLAAGEATPGPTQKPGGSATRRIRLVRWGLVPPWARPGADGGPPKRGPQLINARAETVTTAPAYRSSAQHKRCLIPMDGYYEWRSNADDHPRAGKTPFYFFRSDGKPLLVAGLWSATRTAGTTGPLLSATIITTSAVERFAEVHDRMPLILAGEHWDRWLDPDAPAPDDLLTAPPDLHALEMREVSTLVNNVANNGPELIEPPAADNQPVGLF